MSESSPEPGSSSRGLWYAFMAALPVLYVLSVPPVYLTFLQTSSSSGSAIPDVPAWVDVYSAPFNWLSDIPMLSDSMQAYFFWWMEAMDVQGAW